MLSATTMSFAGHEYWFKAKFSTTSNTKFTLSEGTATFSGNSEAWYEYDSSVSATATYQVYVKNSETGKTIMNKTFNANEPVSKTFNVPSDGKYYIKVVVREAEYARHTYVEGSGTISQ